MAPNVLACSETLSMSMSISILRLFNTTVTFMSVQYHTCANSFSITSHYCYAPLDQTVSIIQTHQIIYSSIFSTHHHQMFTIMAFDALLCKLGNIPTISSQIMVFTLAHLKIIRVKTTSIILCHNAVRTG